MKNYKIITISSIFLLLIIVAIPNVLSDENKYSCITICLYNTNEKSLKKVIEIIKKHFANDLNLNLLKNYIMNFKDNNFMILKRNEILNEIYK